MSNTSMVFRADGTFDGQFSPKRYREDPLAEDPAGFTSARRRLAGSLGVASVWMLMFERCQLGGRHLWN